MVIQARSFTTDAMNIAGAINLGVGGALAANRPAVVQLAVIMVQVKALAAAAQQQANIVNDLISGAIASTAIDSVLYPIVAQITPVEEIAQIWRTDLNWLTDCYQRVTTWIAVGAATGFGVRILVLPGGPPLGGAPLATGFYNPQYMSWYPTHPVVVDVDRLPSALRPSTLTEGDGAVGRTVWAGYDQPTTRLESDVIVPHPVFLYPIIAAPAGSTIRLEGTPSLTPGSLRRSPSRGASSG